MMFIIISLYHYISYISLSIMYGFLHYLIIIVYLSTIEQLNFKKEMTVGAFLFLENIPFFYMIPLQVAITFGYGYLPESLIAVNFSYVVSIPVITFIAFVFTRKILNYLNGTDETTTTPESFDKRLTNLESNLLGNKTYIYNGLHAVNQPKEPIVDEQKLTALSLDSILQKPRLTLERITNERNNLIRRGNFNLLIGIGFAVLGVAVLGYFIIWGNLPIDKDSSVMYIAFQLFPRISLIFILEGCAYFFIRLYKISLAEEKYFQNEATNLEAKFLALEIAIHRDEKHLIDKCVDNLLATERNPNENQQTVELNTLNNTSIDSLIKIIEAVNSKEDTKQESKEK